MSIEAYNIMMIPMITNTIFWAKMVYIPKMIKIVALSIFENKIFLFAFHITA